MLRPLLLLALLSSVAAAAEEATLKIGTVVPDGTGYAREMKALARDVETETHGALRLKFYTGGIAGDELEMMERIRRGQLDGALSAGMACETVAPSMRVARIPGIFQTWPETSYVLGRIRPILDAEAQHNGFRYLGEAIVGPSIIFSRKAVATMRDVQQTRFWIWDIDRMLSTVLPAMSVPVAPSPIADAIGAYEQKRVDGFITPAVAALGFQWSTAARYYTDLRMGFVVGCLIISNRAFDALPLPEQQAIKLASAKMKLRIEQLGRSQEEQLLHGLFQKQGLKPVTVDAATRVAFFEAAHAARDRAATKLVPSDLIARVLAMLADFRSEHRE
ncbi:MAG: TRAP-type C4-dicarboxylate transport system, substrate-binding protein [bacterium]|nr:TRAP-type C4-dicarboxylate transport system, substrate-binding protein [bacterium]